VQTEPHGEVLVSLLLSETSTALDHLTVTLIGARDLASKDATPKVDPQVVIQLDNEKRTSEKLKGTKYPQWDESFTFERAKLPPTVVLQVYDSGTLIGEATLSLEGLHRDIPQQDWHRLMPSETAIAKFGGASGSIRVSVHVSKELILPYPCYSALVAALEKDCTSDEGVQHGIPAVLEELLADPEYKYTDREQVARMLIRILLRSNKSVDFLHSINGLEISGCREPTALFRGNTMASKCTDQFMKIVGLPYLHETLKPAIDLVFREKNNCEIDPYLLPRAKSSKGGGAVDVSKQVQTLTRFEIDHLPLRLSSSTGRCLCGLRTVRDVCLNGLLSPFSPRVATCHSLSQVPEHDL
jgi:RAS protein activator-like 1